MESIEAAALVIRKDISSSSMPNSSLSGASSIPMLQLLGAECIDDLRPVPATTEQADVWDVCTEGIRVLNDPDGQDLLTAWGCLVALLNHQDPVTRADTIREFIPLFQRIRDLHTPNPVLESAVPIPALTMPSTTTTGCGKLPDAAIVPHPTLDPSIPDSLTTSGLVGWILRMYMELASVCTHYSNDEIDAALKRICLRFSNGLAGLLGTQERDATATLAPTGSAIPDSLAVHRLLIWEQRMHIELTAVCELCPHGLMSEQLTLICARYSEALVTALQKEQEQPAAPQPSTERQPPTPPDDRAAISSDEQPEG